MVADVNEVARALGLRRFHILGHILGGRLAHYFATCHPDSVKTVIGLTASSRRRPYRCGRPPLSLRDDLGDQVRLLENANAGHWIQVGQPREVEQVIPAWLAEPDNA